MSDILYELTFNTEGPHCINIRMESDGLDIQEWTSVIQEAMDKDDFVQVYCIRSERWHVLQGGDIVHFSIKQLSKKQIIAKAKRLEEAGLGWPI